MERPRATLRCASRVLLGIARRSPPPLPFPRSLLPAGEHDAIAVELPFARAVPRSWSDVRRAHVNATTFGCATWWLAQRGARAMKYALAAFGVLVGGTLVVAVVAVATVNRSGPSKHDLASSVAKRYAFEAYPAFAVENPGRTCPDKLQHLNEWMPSKTILDPWDRPFVMDCAPHRFEVRSLGEDGRLGTHDDISSHPNATP